MIRKLYSYASDDLAAKEGKEKNDVSEKKDRKKLIAVRQSSQSSPASADSTSSSGEKAVEVACTGKAADVGASNVSASTSSQSNDSADNSVGGNY